QELMSSTPGVQTEKQNGEHPELQARLSPDATESSSKPKGKDRGPNNREEDISEPKVQ
ncbi:hypothetical protein M9458_025441, partial [Cirrhinus mrigala]